MPETSSFAARGEAGDHRSTRQDVRRLRSVKRRLTPLGSFSTVKQLARGVITAVNVDMAVGARSADELGGWQAVSTQLERRNAARLLLSRQCIEHAGMTEDAVAALTEKRALDSQERLMNRAVGMMTGETILSRRRMLPQERTGSSSGDTTRGG